MISGMLIRRAARRYRLVLAGACVLLGLFLCANMLAASSMLEQQTRVFLEIEWVRRIMSGLIGMEITGVISPTGLISFSFTHPMTWTVSLGFVLMLTSGAFAGEIDRGTIDLVATLPISRTSYYTTMTLFVLAAVLPLVLTSFCALWILRHTLVDMDIDFRILARVAFHLYFVIAAVACLAQAIAAGTGRRATAIVVCFVYLFYSLVLNVVGAFWEPIKAIDFTSFLYFYRPLEIVNTGAVVWSDVLVFVAAGAVAWTIGLIIWLRRDFPAT